MSLLRECPFCGFREPNIRETLEDPTVAHEAWCPNCGARGPKGLVYATRETARLSWNARCEPAVPVGKATAGSVQWPAAAAPFDPWTPLEDCAWYEILTVSGATYRGEWRKSYNLFLREERKPGSVARAELSLEFSRAWRKV
jgi:hypothetical protein